VAQRSFPGSKHIAQRLRRHVTSRGVSNSRRGRRLPRDPAAPRPHDASPAELAATTRRTQRRRAELSHLSSARPCVSEPAGNRRGHWRKEKISPIPAGFVICFVLCPTPGPVRLSCLCACVDSGGGRGLVGCSRARQIGEGKS